MIGINLIPFYLSLSLAPDVVVMNHHVQFLRRLDFLVSCLNVVVNRRRLVRVHSKSIFNFPGTISTLSVVGGCHNLTVANEFPVTMWGIS